MTVAPAVLAGDVIVVGNASDDPFAIDIAYALGQSEDIADMISMKEFANSEFCPRFISDESDLTAIGHRLVGKTIVIVSTTSLTLTRNALAMRNLLIARAAKDNGAEAVVLVEPDLFFSAQDRGPRHDQGATHFERDIADLKKFDGQPFSSRLYAQMLRLAGVDRVVTVHNHSVAVQAEFTEVFEGRFHNLIPYDVYGDYLHNSNIVDFEGDGDGLVLCAPDKGAREFVREMFNTLSLPKAKFVLLDKERSGERDVEITLHAESDNGIDEIAGHDLVLFDDMVRTGSTVVKSCEFLKTAKLHRTVFAVSHFYASSEGREKMASPAIDEILTLNTLPTVLNRDVQGRLRKKLVVLKIEQWLARNLADILEFPAPENDSLYLIDMSSKNPRFKHKIWSNDQLASLKGEVPLPFV
ncbi:MAG: phosphoribosyltransferase family protein [Acidimicrobiia bacterium]|nr:phosphoribosyltransferase family protein [Acidimicrobiia bacterium]